MLFLRMTDKLVYHCNAIGANLEEKCTQQLKIAHQYNIQNFEIHQTLLFIKRWLIGLNVLWFSKFQAIFGISPVLRKWLGYKTGHTTNFKWNVQMLHLRAYVNCPPFLCEYWQVRVNWSVFLTLSAYIFLFIDSFLLWMFF